MSLSASDQRRWEQEQPVLEQARKEHPELFVPIKKSTGELLKRVGIFSAQSDRPVGYVKYSPLDFIVEEIRPSGEVVTVDGPTASPEFVDGVGTIYVDLVKVGISTLDAVERMAEGLHIEKKHLGYAGIKDNVALTSQRLSLRTVSLAQVEQLTIENCVLKNILERKGAIQVGNLLGNRFTLFIRTNGKIDEHALSRQIDQIKEKGIMNYYGVQRFGSPRFLSHVFGLYLLRGDYEGCVKAVLTQASEFDLPFYQEKRANVAKHFGDWQTMKELFSQLPFAYRHELQIIDSLIAKPNDFLEALHAVGDQASMWARAYGSYLVNMFLSEAETEGSTLPEELPLLLGSDLQADNLYGKWLKTHHVTSYRRVMRECRFLQVGKNPTIEPVLRPVFHHYQVLDEGVALSFDLQKGAYATTVLEWLFEVVTGTPVPEWLSRNDMDTKQLLGTGDLTQIKTQLATALANAMSSKGQEE